MNKITKKEYHDNGQLSYERNYLNGKHHGINTGYHSNGNLMFNLNYLNGIRHGLSQGWYENGNLAYKHFHLI